MKHIYSARLISALSIFGAATVSAGTVNGQEFNADDLDAVQAVADQSRAQAKQIVDGGPVGSPTFGTLASAFQIETLAGDETASISLAYNRAHPIGQGRTIEDDRTRYTFATDSFSIVASAPLGKNGKPSLFDIDKLSDGTSLEAKVTRFWGSFDYRTARDPRSLAQLQSRLENRCIDAEVGRFVSDDANETDARNSANLLRSELDMLRAARELSPALALERLATSSNAKVAALAAILLKPCVTEADNHPEGNLLQRFGTKADSQISIASKPSGLWFAGARGKIARTNYEFITQTPLAKSDVSKTGYRFESLAGRIFGAGRSSAALSFAYIRRFKPNDDVQLCDFNGVGTQLACFTGPLGPPVEGKSYTLGGEVRALFPLKDWAGGGSLGIAPRVTYEFKSEAPVFEFPIYFAPNKDKALNGGMRLAYTTAGRDDFAFGLFVGIPFSLFFD